MNSLMATSVLLSIKPIFSEKIFEGIKEYEFRKRIFKRKDIDKIYVYASSPISKVVGEFSIERIIEGEKEKVWDITKNGSGISKSYYDEYFSNSKRSYAIKIKDYTRYDTPIDLSYLNIDRAPQSFQYVDDLCLMSC